MEIKDLIPTMNLIHSNPIKLDLKP